MKEIEKWDRRFLDLAKETAEYSKDPSTKVGAVIVDSDKRVVSVGYNGFPQRVRDLPERYENRDLKILGIIHAEMNTVIFAKRCLKGCTVYVFPFPPCCACASVLIQAGIKRCVTFRESPALRERWGKSLSFAEELFREAGVELQIYDS